MTQQPPQPGQPQPGQPIVFQPPGSRPMSAPVQQPVQQPGPTLTPAEMAKRGVEWHVSIQGVVVPGSPSRNKAGATTLLAKEAISRGDTILATVREDAGRSYLSFSPSGEVKKAAAPPPGSLRDDFSLPTDVAATQAIEDGTRAWVEESLLIQQGPVQRPAKRRFSLRRR